jgi:cytochrome b subunit of formate dehydrogenase
MNKARLLKIVNLLLFISMAAQALTGLVLFFDLFVSRAKLFEIISEVHRYNGLVVTLLIITHLAMNWNWIKSQFFKRRAGY